MVVTRDDPRTEGKIPGEVIEADEFFRQRQLVVKTCEEDADAI